MQRAGGDAADEGADVAAEAEPGAPPHQQAADAGGDAAISPAATRCAANGLLAAAAAMAPNSMPKSVRLEVSDSTELSQRVLGPRPLPERRLREIEAERARDLGAPDRVAEGHAPGMAAGREHDDAQQADGDAADDVIARRHVIGAAALGDQRRSSAAASAMLASVAASPPHGPK